MKTEQEEPKWLAEYRAENPLPKFSHWNGFWWADETPIMQTQSMGKSLPEMAETLLDEVPEYVIGAYCGIKRICYGNWSWAHGYRFTRREETPNNQSSPTESA